MKVLNRISVAAALWLGCAAAALASPTIELKDGSRIQGEIQGLENGVYTVRSATLGTVHLKQSDIARIDYDGSGASRASTKSSNDDLTRNILQMQTSLAQDPDLMKSIVSLQDDPQIQAILNDPAIVRAVQEGDYSSLLANPKIKALESNTHLKQIIEQQPH